MHSKICALRGRQDPLPNRVFIQCWCKTLELRNREPREDIESSDERCQDVTSTFYLGSSSPVHNLKKKKSMMGGCFITIIHHPFIYSSFFIFLSFNHTIINLPDGLLLGCVSLLPKTVITPALVQTILIFISRKRAYVL